MAETGKASASAPAAAPPEGAAKSKESKLWLFVGIGGVVVVAVAALLLMGGGSGGKKNEGGRDSGGGDGAARGSHLPLGAQIELPEMTFEMGRDPQADFPFFRIVVVVILKKSPLSDHDAEIQAKEAKIEEAVKKMVPWISQQMTDIIRRIPIQDRSMLLEEAGSRRLADELKSVLNKRFKGQSVGDTGIMEEIVEDVWVPVRRVSLDGR